MRSIRFGRVRVLRCEISSGRCHLRLTGAHLVSPGETTGIGQGWFRNAPGYLVSIRPAHGRLFALKESIGECTLALYIAFITEDVSEFVVRALKHVLVELDDALEFAYLRVDLAFLVPEVVKVVAQCLHVRIGINSEIIARGLLVVVPRLADIGIVEYDTRSQAARYRGQPTAEGWII